MAENNRWESWASGHFSGFWEEMSGLRETLAPDGTRDYNAPQQPELRTDYAATNIPFTELNAARMVRRIIGNHLTYAGSGDRGTWYVWNGIYHEEDSAGIVLHALCVEFADQMVAALNAVGDKYARDIAQAKATGNGQLEKKLIEEWTKYKFNEHRMFQKKLHSDAGLNALASRIKKLFTVSDDYFTDDLQWLVCQNGVIDLYDFRRTKHIDLLPHDPKRPVTRAIRASFRRDAQCVEWDRFLATSQPSDEKRTFMQRMAGAAFMGESKVKAIVNLKGPRDCGKSVFVDTLDQLAEGYGIQPSPDALMQLQGQNWEQDTLRGKRFVGITEPSTGKKLDDTFCKQVTGGDMIRTQAKHKSSVGWRAQCVMFIASNDYPRFNTRDQAFLDRVCVVEFPHQFFSPDEAEPGEIHLKDESLEDKLLDEMDGIFIWVLMGMYNFMRDGIDKPEAVKAAGERVRTSSSLALDWVEEQIEAGRLTVVDGLGDASLSSYVLTTRLFAAYAMALDNDRERPLPRKQFVRELEARYGEQVVSNGRRIPRLIGINSWSSYSSSGAV